MQHGAKLGKIYCVNAEFYAYEIVFVRAGDIPGLLSFLDRAPAASLRDVAFTCAKRWKESTSGEATVAIVTPSVADLRTRLMSASARIASGAAKIRDRSGTFYFRDAPLAQDGAAGPRLAFMFPGGASFYPDMLRDVTIRFPIVRATFDELSEALDPPKDGKGKERERKNLFDPNSFIFPPAPYYLADANVFAAGAYAEATVSVYTANAALARLMAAFGVAPDAVAGYAAGEMNAFQAAGMFGEFKRPERLAFIRELYNVVENAAKHCGLPRCVMVSCLANDEAAFAEFEKLHPPDAKNSPVTLALEQTPRLRTYAILPEAADAIMQELSSLGIRPMKLKVDRPFNTQWAKSSESGFNRFAGHWLKRTPSMAVYSCRTTEKMPVKPRHARNEAAAQFSHPVHLSETIRRMAADGVKVFVEVGPRGITASSASEILRGTDAISLATNAPNRSGIVQLQFTLAALAALGAKIDPAPLFEGRGARMLDFENPMSLEIRFDSQMKLSRAFPRLTLFADSDLSAAADPVLRSAGKARIRAAAQAARDRKLRQFEFGAFAPLVSDADVVSEQPGVKLEVVKTFSFADIPFLADSALGTNGISYSDPALRGLTFLSLPAAAEIMAELAVRLAPRKHVAAIEDLFCRRALFFDKGRVRLSIRAERAESQEHDVAAVKVQIREEAPDGEWTWPAMGATVILKNAHAAPAAFASGALSKPRNVHWTDSEIYPDRLASGDLLQAIRRADVWSEGGLDYTVEVPALAGAVAHTRFPVWEINPQLFTAILDGFQLWRSHERFKGAFSMAFRVRSLTLHTENFQEHTELNCYLRLTGATPKSHICDIQVTDGNGNLMAEISGFEELVERVDESYRQLILAPSLAYLSEKLPSGAIGEAPFKFSTALFTNVPYPLFEKHHCLWLKTISGIVLCSSERRSFEQMPGTVARKAEWLFGRIAAKEAVRRHLSENYQARWSPADVQIWADHQGKPHPLGAWSDFLAANIDLAIAHTAQFVVAIVATNARVGVDVEETGRDITEEFARGVFTPEEIELAVNAVNAPTAMIRLWCAKEAVSKALGTGIRFPPKELVATSLAPDTGEMTVELTGQWLESFKNFKGRPVRVSTSIVHNHVLATCFLQETLF